jgi:hypothetical protein
MFTDLSVLEEISNRALQAILNSKSQIIENWESALKQY